MGKSSPPPPPDYAGAAQQTAASNNEQLSRQTRINRPNMYTPFGTSIWGTDGQDNWSNYINLAPEQQQALEAQNRINAARSGLAEGMLGRVRSATANEPDWASLPQAFSFNNGTLRDSASYGNFNQNPNLSQVSGAGQGMQTSLSGAGEGFQRNVAGAGQGLTNNVASAGQGIRNQLGNMNPLISQVAGAGEGMDLGVAGAGEGLSRGVAGAGANLAFGAEGAGAGLITAVDPRSGILQTDVRGPGGYNEAATAAIRGRQAKQLENQRQQMMTQLTQQGVVPGSEAWKNAMDDVNRQQNDADLAAVTAGLNQGNIEFNQGVQQGNFRNSAVNQALQQDIAAGSFQNQAQNQAFGQRTSNAAMQNAAQRQAFDQGATNAGIQNSAQDQAFRQGTSNANIRNAAQAQAFAQNASNAVLNNSAAQQQAEQDARAAGFQNAAQQQQYQQQAANAALNNSAQQQAFAQNASNAALNNSANNDAFNQRTTAGNFQNAAQQQAFAQNQSQVGNNNQTNLAGAQFNNQQTSANNEVEARRLADFNNATRAQQDMNTNFANTRAAQRQQAIQEMMMRRQLPLNEMNAFLGGQQIGMPQFQGAPNTTAGRGSGVDYTGAANAQYGANMDAFSTRQAQQQGLFSGLGSLGQMFMFSDVELKDNIEQVGELPDGTGTYTWDWKDGSGSGQGVLAQEVEQHDPYAVRMHPSGFKQVDYSRVLKNQLFSFGG
jgi:hypothetical protein